MKQIFKRKYLMVYKDVDYDLGIKISVYPYLRLFITLPRVEIRMGIAISELAFFFMTMWNYLAFKVRVFKWRVFNNSTKYACFKLMVAKEYSEFYSYTSTKANKLSYIKNYLKENE